MKKNNNKGFSLVELIIVIAIMAILIGVLAPQFIKYVERSRESTDLQNIAEIQTAVEAYVADFGETFTDSDTVISFTVADNAITLDGGAPSTCAAELGAYGVTFPTNLKSSRWEGLSSISYSLEDYTWTIDDPDAAAVYFNIDGTVVE